jgi:hypothetical protein
MNSIIRIGLFLFSGCFLLATSVTAFAQKDIFKIATFDYPPIFHTAIDGTPSGTVVETVTYLCEQAELTCQVEVLPFRRAYQKIQNGLVDALLTIKVENFRKCCMPTDWETPWVAGFFTHRSIAQTPKQPDEILGERLITVAGMRSPYEFMPQLDDWHKNKKVTLLQANNAFIATRMFLNKRADFLWGSEDFYWYFKKQNTEVNFNFHPLIARPIVLWVHKDRSTLLNKLNHAYFDVLQNQDLTADNILNPEIMTKRYKEAPFK